MISLVNHQNGVAMKPSVSAYNCISQNEETTILRGIANDTSVDTRRAYSRYNELLEEIADPVHLNECIIESKLEQLEKISPVAVILHRLTLLRLTELTLFCAANYAVNGCCSEVGDLFFNPRLILVHVKGRRNPIAKLRHTPLTIQFKEVASPHGNMVEWLKFNTINEIKKKPVLPHLIDLLNHNNCPQTYLDSIESRMSHISDFMAQSAVPGMTDANRIRISPEKLPCQLDKTIFYELGDNIRLLSTRHPRSKAS